MKCKIVSVDLDNRSEKILCPKCKSEIPLDDGLANCEKLRLIIFLSGKSSNCVFFGWQFKAAVNMPSTFTRASVWQKAKWSDCFYKIINQNTIWCCIQRWKLNCYFRVTKSRIGRRVVLSVLIPIEQIQMWLTHFRAVFYTCNHWKPQKTF